MRSTGKQVIRPTYPSSAVGLASSSSSENNHSSFSRHERSQNNHYNAQERFEMKQHRKASSCFRCEDKSHCWRNCEVDPGNESGKQRADQFLKVKKSSDKRERVTREIQG